MRTLVVYYSRSGNTREVAREIALTLGADIEEIVDRTSRSGLFGYLRSGFESTTERAAPIQPAVKDPREYDLVIVGTPVWGANVSSPVRAYLGVVRGRLQKVAFFCTMGGRGSENVFRKMEQLAGARPVRCLAQREGTRWRAGQKAIKEFAAGAAEAVDPSYGRRDRPAAVAAE